MAPTLTLTRTKYLPHALVAATYAHNWRLQADARGGSDQKDARDSSTGMPVGA